MISLTTLICVASAVAIKALASITLGSVVNGIALSILATRCSVRAIARPPLAFRKLRIVSRLARFNCCRLGHRIISSHNSKLPRCENHSRG
uniref:Uncharacterized protein n=1 Tax=Klebsiella pneumoniae TaxID=573 RepID=W0NZU1_KLEPN|nr:hypothetical protein [Klebsiella pneumoniae]